MSCGMPPEKAKAVHQIIEAAVRGTLIASQALELCRESPELVTLALLSAGQRIAELERVSAGGVVPENGTESLSPSTPSGMVPVYAKPNTPKRHKRPGAKNGHPGARRPRPTRIDRRLKHRLKCCPHRGGRLQRCHHARTRIIEDLPEDIRTEVTEHTIHRDYCPNCKKDVEPVVPDAMPGAALGHRLVALTAWLHYGLGITIAQIVDILGFHLQTQLTPGGLIDAWHRLAEVLRAWYEQIAEEARKSAHLHADETGWRVNGQTHWLWCFANAQVCYYMVDRCLGSPALQKFFLDAFQGVLITDFWVAYESVCAEDRQYCLVHLLRELEKVDERNRSAEWQSFARRLRRLLRAGIRLRKRPDFAPGKFQDQVDRLNARLNQLAAEEHLDADTRRLTKRLRKYAEYVFTFLDYADVPFENNFAERQIRPVVIIRKNSQSNLSDRGARTQAILMSVYRTLRLRGLDPAKTIATALRSYLLTGQLPPLPSPTTASG
jgi:transposase